MRAEITTPLTPERRDLAAAYLALARSVAHDFGRRRPHLWQELVSEAEYGLVKAAQRWRGDPVPSRAFAYHARCQVQRTLLSYLRSLRAAKRSHVAVCLPEGLASLGPNPADVAASRLDAAALLAGLAGRERIAVELLAADGLTYTEAEACTGLNRVQIHRAYHRGLARLRGIAA